MHFPKISRRKMIKNGAAAVAAFSIIPRHVMGGAGYTAASDAATRGIIGWGGMARNHPGYNNARIVAISDCWGDRLKSAPEHDRVPSDVTLYPDWRDLIARDDIDFVHIVTPTHWHGLMVIAAAQAGKDIWCEKPFVRTIGESLRSVQACHCNGTILRVNTWGRYGGTYDKPTGMPTWELKKLLTPENGLMKPPFKVTISGNFRHTLKLDDPRMNGQTNPSITTPPANFNYDMWLGPRPEKPFWWHRVDNSWRGYWDYNSGGLGDMSFHYIDPIQWALGKDNETPVEIIPDTPPQHPDAVVKWRRVEAVYKDGSSIILDGENNATNFVEDAEGKWVRMGYDSNISNLQAKMTVLPAVDRGNTDFMACMRERKKFCMNEDTSHRTCTVMNLMAISLYLGRRLKFDPEKWEFVGDEEANRLVDQPMREPWSYEGLV